VKTELVFWLAMFSKTRLIVFTSLTFSVVRFISMCKRYLERKGQLT